MRYSLLLLGLIALPLLGCTNEKLDAREDRKICVREGFEPSTIEYDKCIEWQKSEREKEEEILYGV